MSDIDSKIKEELSLYAKQWNQSSIEVFTKQNLVQLDSINSYQDIKDQFIPVSTNEEQRFDSVISGMTAEINDYNLNN